jgi:membrane associated rhomboid family serine protease
MGAAVAAMRSRGINPFQTSLGGTIMLNLLITFAIPGISIGGHIGGIVGGAIGGYAVLAPRHMRIPNWATYAVPVGVMVLSFVVSVVAVNS